MHPPPFAGAGAAGSTKGTTPWLAFTYRPGWTVLGGGCGADCCATGDAPCPCSLGRLRSVVGGAPPAIASVSPPATPPAVLVLTLRGATPALVAWFLANRVELLLPSAVLLFDRSDAKGDGAFAGFETDCVRREARMVAGSGRTPALNWGIVLERSGAVGDAATGSVPVFSR